MLVMLWLSLDGEPMQLGLLRKGDWAGVITMAVGLAALQTVLEEGNKDDWFSSALIRRLSVTAVIALGIFVWNELRSAEPLLNLRLLLRRNFGFGTLANFLLGLALYGAVYLLPVYLARVQGYNAEQIGAVMAWNGLPQLVLIPLVPRLMRRVDPRVLIAGGFALFAASMFMNIGMTADYAGPQFLWPNIVRAVGQAFVLTPLSAIATGGIEPRNAGSASALFNMTRNIGGAVGIALLQTVVTKREQFHSSILSGAVSVFDLPTRLRLDALTRYFLAHGAVDPQTAQHKALVAVGRAVQRQAFVMAFSDTFCLLGAALLVALAATLLLKRPAALAAGGH
jgi:DHA2 family multidrug resistance protein